MTPTDTSWIEQRIRPLLTLFAFLGAVLGALQMWIASQFVTKDELASLQAQLKHSHADHMDDYRTIEAGIDRLNKVLRTRLPPKKGDDGDEDE